jgi:hypothetical protein
MPACDRDVHHDVVKIERAALKTRDHGSMKREANGESCNAKKAQL